MDAKLRHVFSPVLSDHVLKERGHVLLVCHVATPVATIRRDDRLGDAVDAEAMVKCMN